MNYRKDKHALWSSPTRRKVERVAVSLGGPTVVLLIAFLLISGVFPGTLAPRRNDVTQDPTHTHSRQLLVLRAEPVTMGMPLSNNIWMIRADGTDLHRVTNEAHGVLDYAISPDSTRIVFVTTDEESSTALWLVGIDGSNRTRLSSPMEPARYLSPTWSPAGDAILYVRYELSSPRPRGTITLVSETGKIWAIAPTGKTIGRVYGNGDEAGQAPTWSPDASRAALLEVFPQIGTSNIVITNFSGRPIKIPVDIALHMSWSPDGQWLAFDELTAGNRSISHIVLLQADGTDRKPLFTDMTKWDSTPIWSPDGKTLAFVRRHDAVPTGAVGRPDEIWRTTTDGTELHPILRGANLASSDLSWSPDGQMLAATRYTVTRSTQRGIWIVNSDGTEARLLIDNATQAVWLR